jgi:hypothetical protein
MAFIYTKNVLDSGKNLYRFVNTDRKGELE